MCIAELLKLTSGWFLVRPIRRYIHAFSAYCKTVIDVSCRNFRMLKLPNPFRIISRNKTKYFQKYAPLGRWKEDAVDYGHVKYYPRFPGHKDPEFTPSKCLLVERVKPYKGQPWWHKKALEDFKIHDDKGNRFAIVKNQPTICSKLYAIKHLIRVTPIDIPENFSEEDIELGGTFLDTFSGKFNIIQKVDPVRIEDSERYEKHERKMDKVTIKRQLRYKWLNPME